MSGYTEVLQTMGAMIIFSLILLTSNRMIQRNNVLEIEGELEQETVALAQDIIEEARTKEFDATTTGNLPPVNIPGSFTSPGELGAGGPPSEDERDEFNDFDDYNGWSQDILTEHGEFNVRAEVFYVTPYPYDSTNVRTTFKKMRVFVTSKFLRKNGTDENKQYKFEFIRNYYAD